MTKKEAQIYAKAREDYKKELVYKAEQAKLNSNAFNRVMDGFADEFKQFDWEEEIRAYRPWNDTFMHKFYPVHEAYSVRNAIGTLAKAAFKAKTVKSIPCTQEKQLRDVTQKLLSVVLAARKERS